MRSLANLWLVSSLAHLVQPQVLFYGEMKYEEWKQAERLGLNRKRTTDQTSALARELRGLDVLMRSGHLL